MQTFQLLGVAAAVITIAAFMPHSYRCIKEKQSMVLSTLQLITLFAGSILWIFYGIRDSSPAIVVLSIFTFVVTTILLAQKRQAPQQNIE